MKVISPEEGSRTGATPADWASTSEPAYCNAVARGDPAPLPRERPRPPPPETVQSRPYIGTPSTKRRACGSEATKRATPRTKESGAIGPGPEPSQWGPQAITKIVSAAEESAR